MIETKSLLKALMLFIKFRKKYEDCVLTSCFKYYRGHCRLFYYIEYSNSSPCTSPDMPDGGALYGNL